MTTLSRGWITIGLFCAATTSVTAAGTMAVLSPSGAPNIEGNDFQRPNIAPVRIQHLIPASDFAGLPASHRLLVAFNFRADRSQTQSIDWGPGEERIWMSTTDKSVLTATFDSNHGTDRTLVHDDLIKYPLLATGPVEGPRDVAPGHQLQTPFHYDPVQGNLLIDRLVFLTSPSAQANIDTQRTSTARILINDANPFSATGDLLTEIAVMQFEFAAVPEPSSLVLAGIAVGGLVACRFQRRRRHRTHRCHVSDKVSARGRFKTGGDWLDLRPSRSNSCLASFPRKRESSAIAVRPGCPPSRA